MQAISRLSIFIFCALFFQKAIAQTTIVGQNTACIDQIFTFTKSQFPCAAANPAAASFVLPSNFPAKILGNDSLAVQFTQRGETLISCRCANSTTQSLRITVNDCDTVACIGNNIVPNPSFEIFSNCETRPVFNLGDLVLPWNDISNPRNLSGSSDFFSPNCPVSSNFPFIFGINTTNKARTGNGYIGQYLFSTGTTIKEYVNVPLTEPLKVGRRYRVKFYLKTPSAFGTSQLFVDRVGVAFFSGDVRNNFEIENPGTSGPIVVRYIGNAPSVESVGTRLGDSVFWTKIEGVFTATAPHTQMIMGNFFQNATQLSGAGLGYYLFDDFSVEELGAAVRFNWVQADTIICSSDTARLRFTSAATSVSLKNITNNTIVPPLSTGGYDLINVADNSCYELSLSNITCRDTVRFCVRVQSKYDTLITEKVCNERDTGLIQRLLQTIRGCDSLVRVRRVFDPTPDTMLLNTFVCDARDTSTISRVLKNQRGCDSVVILRRTLGLKDTVRLPNLISCNRRDTGEQIGRFVNRFGCDSFVLQYTQLVLPTQVDLGNDTLVLEGTAFGLYPRFSSDSIQSVKWSPATNLSCTDCRNPQIVAASSVFYTLTVVSKGGCTTQASRWIRIDRQPFIYIPTAFSPNGDGINETLVVYAATNRVKSILRFNIFNRWGNLIFEKRNFQPNDEQNAWRGDDAPIGTYVYFVEIELYDGQHIVISGDINLIR